MGISLGSCASLERKLAALRRSCTRRANDRIPHARCGTRQRPRGLRDENEQLRQRGGGALSLEDINGNRREIWSFW